MAATGRKPPASDFPAQIPWLHAPRVGPLRGLLRAPRGTPPGPRPHRSRLRAPAGQTSVQQRGLRWPTRRIFLSTQSFWREAW